MAVDDKREYIKTNRRGSPTAVSGTQRGSPRCSPSPQSVVSLSVANPEQGIQGQVEVELTPVGDVPTINSEEAI